MGAQGADRDFPHPYRIPPVTTPTNDILLIGGGHAHVAVLADWAKNGPPGERVTLLTPAPTLRYSGMVPGWIAGEHAREDGLVDLAGLARAARARLVLDRCVAIDPVARSVLTQASGVLEFALASIDVGGVGRADAVLGAHPRLLDVRPIKGFARALAAEFAQPRVRPLKVAVVGGGAGGVELALGLRNAKYVKHKPEVTLVAGSGGPVPDLSPRVARKVRAELARQHIPLIAADARFEGGSLRACGSTIEADLVIGAIGSGAPDWPRLGGLAVDEEGFIAIDRHQRSLSHAHIFAAGDCAARADRAVPHSGVHAVFAGPVLADNLRAVAGGHEPRRSYTPRWNSLYLLSTGQGEAIASYGPLAAQGRWVARLKTWIDRRWIAKYAAISRNAETG
jgi:NADH dehydrogenase FAD-containing subunit